jgi:hypothetical protein
MKGRGAEGFPSALLINEVLVADLKFIELL